jgi:hypothetical protein
MDQQSWKIAAKTASQFSTALRSLSKLFDRLAENHEPTSSPPESTSSVQICDPEPHKEVDISDLPEDICETFLKRFNSETRGQGMWGEPTKKLFEFTIKLLYPGRTFKMDASKRCIREWGGKTWKVADFNIFTNIMQTSRDALAVINEEVDKRKKRAGQSHFMNFERLRRSQPLAEYLKDLTPDQKQNKYIVSLHEYLQTVSKPSK